MKGKSHSSRLPPVDSFLTEDHLIALRELAYAPKQPPRVYYSGPNNNKKSSTSFFDLQQQVLDEDELDAAELLQWNLNFRHTPPGIFLPDFVKKCLQLLRQDEETYESDNDNDDDDNDDNGDRNKLNMKAKNHHRHNVKKNQETEEEIISIYRRRRSSGLYENMNSAYNNSSSLHYISIAGHQYLERDLKIALIRWAIAVGVRARVDQDMYSTTYNSNSSSDSSSHAVVESIMRSFNEKRNNNQNGPLNVKKSNSAEERYFAILKQTYYYDEAGNRKSRSKNGVVDDSKMNNGNSPKNRRSPLNRIGSAAAAAASMKNSNSSVAATMLIRENSNFNASASTFNNTGNFSSLDANQNTIGNCYTTITDINSALNIDFNTIISPSEIRLTTDALLGPSEILTRRMFEKKKEIEEKENLEAQVAANAAANALASSAKRTFALPPPKKSARTRSFSLGGGIRRRSSFGLLSRSASKSSFSGGLDDDDEDDFDDDGKNEDELHHNSKNKVGIGKVHHQLEFNSNNHNTNDDEDLDSRNESHNKAQFAAFLSSTAKGNNKNNNNNNGADPFGNFFGGAANSNTQHNDEDSTDFPSYWERDLRDYFLRWTDITTALLAGAAKSAFQDQDDATAGAAIQGIIQNNDDADDGDGIKKIVAAASSFSPYASTRVVKSLRKKAMAAAKLALLGKNSSLTVGENSDDEENFDEYDDDDEDFGNTLNARAMLRQQQLDTEILHHGPVTSAVLAPKLNGIVTGSTDGTVKLWSRDCGDFIKNLYCCSGRTTIVGLAYVECGSASDVVVIGTSTSHLALYSTMTNSIVKEYSGTSETKNFDTEARDSNGKRIHVPRPVAHVPLRPTATTSRFRALPGAYGRRLIRPPPISSNMDSKTFFDEWRVAQDKEIRHSVPAAQVHNLSRLSLLKTIYPANYTHGVVCFGTADGDVGLLDLHEDFIDAVLYGQPTERFLSSHNLLRTHTNTVTAVAYCKRHRSILSSAFDGTVIPRNIDTNELATPIGFKTKAIVSMDWCENQQMLATVTTDRKAYAWSFLGKRAIHQIELDARPVSVILHSGKSQMAILCDDRQMLVYDTRTFRCLQGLSVVTDQAEREATIVVGGLDADDSINNAVSGSGTIGEDELSAKTSTLASVNASSNYISPYDSSATMQLAAGGGNGRNNKSLLQQYQAENHTGMLLSDGNAIVAVHREVSVMKDALGKVSVRVRQGKIPVYGFRFDVYDEELEKQQKDEDLRIKQQQLLFDQSFSASANGLMNGRRGTFAASIQKLSASVSSPFGNNNNNNNTSPRSRSFFGAASAIRAPPVLKSSPVGLLYNKHNGSIVVGDGDGFIAIDVKTGEVLMCAATEKNLGQTTPSVASGGRLVAGSQSITWTPCDSGKLRGIQHDTFLTLSKAGCITEWNAIDGAALRVTLPHAWASCIGKKHKRPRKDKIFSVMAICEKFTAVCQGDFIFVLNEVARKAPKPTDLNLLNEIFVDSTTDSNANVANSLMTGNAGKTVEEVNDEQDEARKEVLGLVGDLKTKTKKNTAQEAQSIAAAKKSLNSAQTVADVRKWQSEKSRREETEEMSRRAASIQIRQQRVGKFHDENLQLQRTTAKEVAKSEKQQQKGKENNEKEGTAQNETGSSNNSNNNHNHHQNAKTEKEDIFHNRSFAGHDAFSVECADTVTALKFSAGGEYLAIGTQRGLLQTVHVDTSENIYMTLSMLRAGEPTSPIVCVTWNDHVGDCTVFAGLALGRIVAIHAPTRTVMLSLSVDLGPKLSPTLLSTLAVCRHQSRAGHALEVLSFGDSSGNVSVATLQVKKRRELIAEEDKEKEDFDSHVDNVLAASNLSLMTSGASSSLKKNKNIFAKNGTNNSRPNSRASSVCSSNESSVSRSSKRNNSKSNKNTKRKPSHHRTTSFSFQQIVHKHDGSGFTWSEPVLVQQLPAKDHSLKRLKSLKSLYGDEDEDGKTIPRDEFHNGGDGSKDQERINLDFTNLDSTDSSTSDSDDDPEVRLKKVVAKKDVENDGDHSDNEDDDDDDEEEENEDPLADDVMENSQKERDDFLTKTKVYMESKSNEKSRTSKKKIMSTNNTSSTSNMINPTNSNSNKLPDGAHQSLASKRHERAKLQRRSAILSSEHKKLLSDPNEINSITTNRAVAKMRGKFNKRRKGYIFEDAYCFINPSLLSDDNNNNNTYLQNNNPDNMKKKPSSESYVDYYANLEGNVVTRSDQKLERPVWVGYVDGVISLGAKKKNISSSTTTGNNSSGGGGVAVGAVTHLVFLELKRVGMNYGLALFAAATADGNVSLLRWSRMSDQVPAELISLCTLKCPISSMSRGPFWHESKVELDIKEHQREVQERIQKERREQMSSSSFSREKSGSFASPSQQQDNNNNNSSDQHQHQQEAFKSLGRRKSINFTVVTPESKTNRNNNNELTTFLTQPALNSVTPNNENKNSATLASFISGGAAKSPMTTIFPTPPPPPPPPPLLQRSALGSFAATAKITTKLIDRAKVARLQLQDKLSLEYLPKTSAWSPMGTGVEHDDTNMVYCLDDRWDQCDERDLKGRPAAGPSRASLRAERRRQQIAELDAKKSRDKERKKFCDLENQARRNKEDEEERDREKLERKIMPPIAELIKMHLAIISTSSSEKEIQKTSENDHQQTAADIMKVKNSMVIPFVEANDQCENDDENNRSHDDIGSGIFSSKSNFATIINQSELTVLESTRSPANHHQLHEHRHRSEHDLKRQTSIVALQKTLAQMNEKPGSFVHAVHKDNTNNTTTTSSISNSVKSPAGGLLPLISARSHSPQSPRLNNVNVNVSTLLTSSPSMRTVSFDRQSSTLSTNAKNQNQFVLVPPSITNNNNNHNNNNLTVVVSPRLASLATSMNEDDEENNTNDLTENVKLFLDSPSTLPSQKQQATKKDDDEIRTSKYSSYQRVRMAKCDDALLSSARQLSMVSSTVVVGGDGGRAPTSPITPTTTQKTSPKNNKNADDIVEMKNDEERGFVARTFQRLKQLRPELIVNKQNPLLDAVTLKQEQVEDIRRDVTRQLEKEQVPAWMKALRSTSQPLSIQQVHIMSRPPPILLKNHVRVNNFSTQNNNNANNANDNHNNRPATAR